MDIIFVGAGGCMRELVWQMQEENKIEQNTQDKKWNILGFVDRQPSALKVGGQEIAYLGDDTVLLEKEELVNVVIAVGSPTIRKKIYEKLSRNKNLQFPVIVLHDTAICSDIKMGQGCIISKGVKISTNCSLGEFVFVNLDALICHDARIGEFVTISPAVKIAGNVQIGSHSDIGIGATIIQGMSIGEGVILGAGSVVVKPIEDRCTAVGVPAKKIKT